MSCTVEQRASRPSSRALLGSLSTNKFGAKVGVYLKPANSVAAGLRAMGRKQKKSQDRRANVESQGGTFSIMQGEVDGRPVIAMIDTKLRDLRGRQGLPFSLSLSSPLIGPASEGLPTEVIVNSLSEWEDAVEARLQPVSKFAFVGRVTWNGNREPRSAVKMVRC
jgi:hypothetical protein